MLYHPLLRANEVRKGEVTLVLTPVTRGPDQDPLEVLKPKPAESRRRGPSPTAPRWWFLFTVERG